MLLSGLKDSSPAKGERREGEIIMNILKWIFSRNVVSQASELGKPKHEAPTNSAFGCKHQWEQLWRKNFWGSAGAIESCIGESQCRICGKKRSWNSDYPDRD